jgi:ABC-type polysaccharide/polyol phosphate export permease
MVSYFRSIWECRHFWLSLVKLDLRTRYRRSVLGIGWSLLHPVCMTAIMCLVFHKLFHQSVIEYAPYVLTGLAIWHYIVNCTLQGCQSFFIGEKYIRQMPMPMAIFPLRTVLSATFHFAIAMGLVLAMVIAMGAGGYRELHPLAMWHAVPGVLMLFVFCWSMAVLAGLMTVFFHDAQHIAEVGFQIGFYATPILYRTRLLKEAGMGWVSDVNPAVVFLRMIRDPILDGIAPSAFTYFKGLVMIAVVAGLACMLMARLQKRLIFHL